MYQKGWVLLNKQSDVSDDILDILTDIWTSVEKKELSEYIILDQYLNTDKILISENLIHKIINDFLKTEDSSNKMEKENLKYTLQMTTWTL